MQDALQASPSNVVLVHGFDPRGLKVGGLETYSRDFIRHKPDHVTLWVIGVDAFGDLHLGQWHDLSLDGVKFRFMPVTHFPESQMAEAATRVWKSLTGKFVSGLLRFGLELRKTLPKDATFDLRRVETAWLPTVLRRPFIQMLHGEGAPKKQMDSLLSRFPFVHNGMQGFSLARCAAFLCVNPLITQRIKEEYPAFSRKVGTLPTWANPRIFTVSEAPKDKVFRVVFCGRLDKFKRPDLIFRVVQLLGEKMQGGVELHLVGASDPDRFVEFESVRRLTTLHGAQNAEGVHSVISSTNCGLLTSEFEGLPRFVLECLATGRPVVSSALPQLIGIIKNGENGYLVDLDDEVRFVEEAATALEHVARTRNAWSPSTISRSVADYTPEKLLSLVYGYHQAIKEGRDLDLLA